MNDNENKDNNNKSTSNPSHEQKDAKKIEGEDKKAKISQNENSSGSANSIKPGAVAVEEGDESKIKKKKEFREKYNAPIHRAVASSAQSTKSEESGSKLMKDGNQEIIEKKKAMDASKNTSPGAVAVKDADNSNAKERKKLRSQMYKRDGNQEIIEKKKAMDASKTTSPGAITVKDADNSNAKERKKLRSQIYKRKTAVESTASLTNEIDKKRLMMKTGEDIRLKYSTPFSNDASGAQENLSEMPALLSEGTNAQRNDQFVDEEISSNEEDNDFERNCRSVSVGIDNYEMPIATIVNDSEVAPELHRTILNDIDDGNVYVDAQVSILQTFSVLLFLSN